MNDKTKDLSELLADGYILVDNKGKIEVIERPEYGSIKISFTNSIPIFKDTLTKEKIY